MNPALQKLREEFPRLFPPSADRWYGEIRCEVGWETLLRDLLRELAALNSPITVALLKEKFGGLRIHLNGVQEEDQAEVQRLKDIAKAAADATCEKCGAPGTLRQRRWIVVLCDSCTTENPDDAV